MGNIEWIAVREPAKREEIESIEAALGIVFPDDFIKCAMVNHGASPIPCVFDFGDESDMLNNLLSFTPNEAINVLETYDAVRDRLVDGVYPFADDPGGNMLCFDYRQGDSPTVVFWDHEVAFTDPERAITPICNTFTELLEMLRPFEDEE